MPFDKSFDDIYKFGIKAACEEAGAYCERVDEQIFLESMLERIYNQIAKADIIVADMTGRNPMPLTLQIRGAWPAASEKGDVERSYSILPVHCCSSPRLDGRES
jgi:hypothetical protein